MKFTVKRSEWHRGLGSTQSRLLTYEGKRCCIGFVGQQCGISDEHLRGRSTIRLVEMSRSGKANSTGTWPEWMLQKDNGLRYDLKVGEAYEINDSQEITDEQREERLKEVFIKHGDEIEFVD